MSYKIRYRFLQLNARLLRHALAVIGMAGILTSCSSSGKKDDVSNQDSLKKVKEKNQQDSIAKIQTDKEPKQNVDSIMKAREDSIKNSKLQQNQPPTITKYGVPDEPYSNPTATKYGVRSVNTD